MKDYVKDCQLNFVRIKFSPQLKVAELKYLCESHGLLLKPEEEVEFVEEKRFCIVKCAFRKAMNYDNEQFKLLQNDVECMVQIISKRLRRSSLVIVLSFYTSDMEILDLYKQTDTYWKNWLKIGIEDIFPDNESKKPL